MVLRALTISCHTISRLCGKRLLRVARSALGSFGWLLNRTPRPRSIVTVSGALRDSQTHRRRPILPRPLRARAVAARAGESLHRQHPVANAKDRRGVEGSGLIAAASCFDGGKECRTAELLVIWNSRRDIEPLCTIHYARRHAPCRNA
jgi:hypothetical protein